MKIDIRKSIIQNFSNSSYNDIEESIKASISAKDEITLPGLGVFFELLWENSDDATKKLIIDNIIKGV